MIADAGFLAAFGIGLAGAAHCLGMCGGIAAALSLGGQRSTATTLAYHSGRLCSYALLGAALAAAAGTINLATWTIALRYLAGLLMIAMGLAIADWWRGITVLERAGTLLWKPVQSVVGKLVPLRHWSHAAVLGLGWGMMPCGLIYSALAWAATSQEPATGALLMLCFGLGTLPAMLTTSFGAGQVQALLRQRGLKLAIALLLIAAGVWSLSITYRHGAHIVRPMGEPMPTHNHEMHSGAEAPLPPTQASVGLSLEHALESSFKSLKHDSHHPYHL